MTQRGPEGHWTTGRVPLPLGKKRVWQHMGGVALGAPGKGVGSEVPGTLRRPEAPTSQACSLPYFLKPQDACIGGGGLPREDT